jgi:hypothetical protein
MEFVAGRGGVPCHTFTHCGWAKGVGISANMRGDRVRGCAPFYVVGGESGRGRGRRGHGRTALHCWGYCAREGEVSYTCSRLLVVSDGLDSARGELGFDVTGQEPLRGVQPSQGRVQVGERESAHEQVSLFA